MLPLVSRIRFSCTCRTLQSIRHLTGRTSPNLQPIKSLQLDEAIEKVEATRSSIAGLFVGKADVNVMSFPQVLADPSELEKIQEQRSMIVKSFASFFLNNGLEELRRLGFYDLKALSATEIASIMEGIGYSEADADTYHDLTVSLEYNMKIMQLIHDNFNDGTDYDKFLIRHSIASYLMGKMKLYHKKCLEHVRSKFGIINKWGYYDLNMLHLYEIIRETYIMETLCYYNAGMIDSFVGRDLHPELLLQNIICNECVQRLLKSADKLIGREKKVSIGQMHDILAYFDTVTGALLDNKLELGRYGIESFGEYHRERIDKARYKLYNDEELTEWKPEFMGIDVFFGPAYLVCASKIEEMTVRLQQDMDEAYMKNCQDKESTALHVAENVSDIMSLLVCVTRASRMQVLHIDNLDADLVITFDLVMEYMVKAKQGSYAFRRQLFTQKFMDEGYFCVSPFLLYKGSGEEQLKLQSEENKSDTKRLE